MTGFIILMASFMASVAVSIDAMLPALKNIGEGLNVTDMNQTQYIIVFIFAGMSAGQLVCGPLSDALGRKKVLYGGLALYALGSLVSLFSHSLTVMLIGRVLQGLGVSGPYVSAVAIIRDKFSGNEMARIMSLVMTIFIVVPCIAPMLGQGIIFFLNWRWIFGLLFVVAVGLGLWCWKGLEETLPEEKRIKFRPLDIALGFREVFANRTTAYYMIAMGLIFGGFIGYLNTARQIFQDLFQTGPYFSLYFGGLALIFGGASMYNSRVVMALGMRPLCRYAGTAIIVSSVLFLIYCGMFGSHLWPFVGYAAVLYFSMGLMFGNLNSIAMEPMGHIAGIASAVIGSTSSVISLTLSTLIGQMYDGTLIPLTCGFLVLGASSLVMMWQGDKKQPEAAAI